MVSFISKRRRFFLISKPQRFAHNEKDYDKQHNITLNELKVGLGLVNLLNENKADSHGTALEIGCGTGLLSIGLAKYATYPKYVFTDPSPQFLQITNKKLKMTQINLATVHFAILKAEEIECLPCEEFSLIVMRSVLHHVLHVKKFIHDVAVCLRPGGIFTFQEPCMEGYVLMGALAQFIPLVIKTTGKILSNDQTKQVELFIKTMQFYARRDIDKSTAEDKHLFQVDELMKIGFEAGLDFEFIPNGTYEHFAASPQERNSHRLFYSFFYDYLKYLMSFDLSLMNLIDQHFSIYCAMIDDLAMKNNGPYMQGVFVCRKR